VCFDPEPIAENSGIALFRILENSRIQEGLLVNSKTWGGERGGGGDFTGPLSNWLSTLLPIISLTDL
jgi:hypothetical protein